MNVKSGTMWYSVNQLNNPIVMQRVVSSYFEVQKLVRVYGK